MKRIIVGVDGSDSAAAAIDWALDYAASDDVVVFAHVWQLSAPREFDIGYEYAAKVEEAANLLVDGLVTKYRTVDGPTIEALVQQGHAGQRLIDAAADADLLVVGRRGYGGFKGLLLGSISTYVVHHATSPIVIITADED